eukprot:9208_1
MKQLWSKKNGMSDDEVRITWKQCCDSILFKNENAFYRVQEAQDTNDKLDTFYAKLMSEYASVKDGILSEYFESKSNDYVLMRDPFPFHLTTNITQYIFISTSKTHTANYDTLHTLIQRQFNLSNTNMDPHYIFSAFSPHFMSTFYPFLMDFPDVVLIFIKQNETKYTESPQCEPHIVWDECMEYIAEEWYHLFWSHYDITRTLSYIKQSDDAQDVLTLFENPFYLFQGIHHYVLLSVATHPYSTSEIHRLMSNDSSHCLYFEERSNIHFIRPFIDDRIQLLSEFLSPDKCGRIYHVLIKNDVEYYDGCELICGDIKDKITYTWNELSDIISKGELGKLGRDERWQRKYANERKEYTKIFKDTGAMILIDRFKTAAQCVDKANNDWRLEAIVDENTQRMCWTVNDYPYRYFEGIEHNVLWYLGDDHHENTKKEMIPFIEHNVKPNYVYEIYLNPPHLKSVLELNHVHVVSVDLSKYYEMGCGALKIADAVSDWNLFYGNANIQNKHWYEGTIGRTERMCRKYHKYWTQNDRMYETRKDLILHKVFGYEVVLNEKSGKLCAVIGDTALDVGYKLIENKFEYNVSKDVKQYVLFCLKVNDDTQEIENIIEAEVKANMKDYVYWKPSENQKTIHDIMYYNIFVRGT